ncbi:hypothetical protein H5410_041389 [Solanum commersonii]|uniref:Uncharacterized protein n=1 Tax=Solanum commersonii TaxID=4109 RepID=A0A9J5XRF7_SOLCO|nr:hypothetical protein H5410_041389 [Solanum commersonii]
MDHRLWMYNMHYDTHVGLKPELIDGVRDFIKHRMTLDILKDNRLIQLWFICTATDLSLDILYGLIMEKEIDCMHVGIIEIDNFLDVAYQNYVAIVEQQVDVELETTLQHPQHILEEVSDDEILNMSSDGNGDRHHEHLGSRRPIDPENIAGSISYVPEHISHDTHIFVVMFGTADPRHYYPNYSPPFGAFSTSRAIRRARPLLAGTLYPIGTSPKLSAMRIGDSSTQQSDAMAGTPLLTQCFLHPHASPLSIARPCATPDDKMSALAPGQKDKLGRVTIEPDGSSLITLGARFQIRYNLIITTTFKRRASAKQSSWLKKVRDNHECPDWMLPYISDELHLY